MSVPATHTSIVRMLVALLATFAVSTTALAAAVDPRVLVIRAADVPAGFRLEVASSGVRTNAQEAKEFPGAGRLFRRWGRITGYQVIFERDKSTIEARVDVFRSPSGPREMLRWADRQVRLSGIRGVKRADAHIGEESFVVAIGAPWLEVYVYWRHGVVWSALGGRGLTKARALALARLQQRRIDAALR
jgi:hypothetical protein